MDLTRQELLEFTAGQPCVKQIEWNEAWIALANAPDGPDKIEAEKEMERIQSACSCLTCTARREHGPKAP